MEPLEMEDIGTDSMQDESKGNNSRANFNEKEIESTCSIEFPKRSNLRKYDADPNTNKVHSYFVNFPYDKNLSLEAKIEEAEKFIQKNHQARSHVAEKLQEKKLDRDQASSKLGRLKYGNYYWSMVNRIRRQDPAWVLNRPRSVCLREERKYDIIKTSRYRIHHGSNNLVEEKKLLREIKEAEEARNERIVDVGFKPNSPNHWCLRNVTGSTQAKNDKIKEKLAFNAQVKRLERQLEAEEKEVKYLQRELEDINRNKDKAYGYIFELRRRSKEPV